MRNDALRPWELALLLALCLTFLVGLWADGRQRALAGEILRLHVVGASDAPEDQAEKLQARDRVLAALMPLLAGCRTREEAVDIILSQADELAALSGGSVTLGTEPFPRRDYADFSLPAGEYLSLRIVLGEGRGANWWCVVFPPLCTETLAEGVDETEAFSALDAKSADLIAGSGREYDLRFRVVDWWGQLKEIVNRHTARDPVAGESRAGNGEP